jgi:hypothetical protein
MGGYFLIFIVHCVIEFGFTNLTKHFGIYLSSVAVCSIFIILFRMLFPFCLVVSQDMEGSTSIDNIVRRDSSIESRLRRNLIEKPPSSIA